MLSRTWKNHQKVFSVPNNVLEDFVVVAEDGGFRAYYITGITFQKMALFCTNTAPAPQGPFEGKHLLESGEQVRLYKGKIDTEQQLITAIWPGIPKAGVWLFKNMPYGIVKTLLIPPKGGTQYSVVAGNPTIIFDGADYNIFFEGRNDIVRWKIFQAVWDGDKNIKVFDDPLWEGANPAITQFDDVYYFYYSKYVDGGFETWVCTQDKG